YSGVSYNGSTTVSKTVCVGSIPTTPAKKCVSPQRRYFFFEFDRRPHRLSARTSGSHPEKRGPTPLGATRSKNYHQYMMVVFVSCPRERTGRGSGKHLFPCLG